MNAKELLDKWARTKLAELDYLTMPEEDDIVKVSFSTQLDGCCEMCYYNEEVIEFSWTGGEYTYQNHSMMLNIAVLFQEALDMADEV